MVKVAVWLIVPKALLAVSVAVLVPEVVGVPVINPLVAMERPVGRLDPVNVIGAVPLAVTVLLNATPTCPRKELVEVNCGETPVGLVSVTELATRKPKSANLHVGSPQPLYEATKLVLSNGSQELPRTARVSAARLLLPSRALSIHSQTFPFCAIVP
jgi:hypothetical protein